jgi:nicotinate-nucleotide--dimethylbenzimidazole phosphoribosyltransferase
MFDAPPIAALDSSAPHNPKAQDLAQSQSALHRDWLRLAQITEQPQPDLQQPQLLLFAADHGVAASAAAYVSATAEPNPSTTEQVLHILQGRCAAAQLLASQGFALTLVDAGLADDLPDIAPQEVPAHWPASVQLVKRKIAHGSRNVCLAPAMSEERTLAALNAGMELAHLLPGNVLALGSLGVGDHISAALLAARLSDIPIERLSANASPSIHSDVLTKANLRHAFSVSPTHALCAFGGYDIAMLCGAMLQAAAERRVVLASGFVSGVAALLAQRMASHVTDYILWAAHPSDSNEQLLVNHLDLHVLPLSSPRFSPGSQALMAWPWLQLCAALGSNAASDNPADAQPVEEHMEEHLAEPDASSLAYDSTSTPTPVNTGSAALASEAHTPSTYPTPLQV